MSIFQADGNFYFYLPNDLPFLSRLTANIQVYADRPLTLDGFVPCFASGARIMTRRGNVLVEDIRPGEIVMDTSGRQHEVLWVGSNMIDLTTLPDDHYLKLVPVRIKADLIDTRAPFADLVVSQQHRIQIRHPMTETLFGVIDCFVPALSLVGFMAEFATDMDVVTYHHILCAEHVTLLANGIEAESLFLGDVLRDGLRPALQEEIRLVFPQFETLVQDPDYATCLPTLKTYEARMLSNIIPGPATGLPTPLRPVRTPDHVVPKRVRMAEAADGEPCPERPATPYKALPEYGSTPRRAPSQLSASADNDGKWRNSPYAYPERSIEPSKLN